MIGPGSDKNSNLKYELYKKTPFLELLETPALDKSSYHWLDNTKMCLTPDVCLPEDIWSLRWTIVRLLSQHILVTPMHSILTQFAKRIKMNEPLALLLLKQSSKVPILVNLFASHSIPYLSPLAIGFQINTIFIASLLNCDYGVQENS